MQRASDKWYWFYQEALEHIWKENQLFTLQRLDVFQWPCAYIIPFFY